MCNRYKRTNSYGQYVEEFSQTRLPLRFPDPQHAPDVEPQEHVRPMNIAPILRARDDGVEMVMMRWWLVPVFHRGALKEWRSMCTNARAETVRTARSSRSPFERRRCLVPAEGWYEWKEEGKPKPMFFFEPRDQAPIMLAGIWDRTTTTDKGVVESFAIVTQPAGALLNGWHNRAPVVLFQDEWATWLDLFADVDHLLGPKSADRFEASVLDGLPKTRRAERYRP